MSDVEEEEDSPKCHTQVLVVGVVFHVVVL